jgi:hypothetical protein
MSKTHHKPFQLNGAEPMAQNDSLGTWSITSGELCAQSKNTNVFVKFNSQFSPNGVHGVALRRNAPVEELLITVNGMVSLSLADFNQQVSLLSGDGNPKQVIASGLRYLRSTMRHCSLDNFLSDFRIYVNRTEMYNGELTSRGASPVNTNKGNRVYARFNSNVCMGKVVAYDTLVPHEQVFDILGHPAASIHNQSCQSKRPRTFE